MLARVRDEGVPEQLGLPAVVMTEALVDEAPRFGYWKVVGMILAENAAGLALARGLGFQEVGTHRAHARREGAWRDVTIVERHLEVGP